MTEGTGITQQYNIARHDEVAIVFSALTLLVRGRKSIQHVKNSVMGCWCGYLSGARCRFAYGSADAIATHYILLQQIQIGFTFLAPAHLGSLDKGLLNGCCCT